LGTPLRESDVAEKLAGLEHRRVSVAKAVLSGGRRYLTFVLLLFLLACASVLSPSFLSANNLVSVAYGSSVLGIVALGQTMLLITGNFDMSVAGVIGAAGIATLLLMPFGAIPAIFAGLGVGLAVGFLNGFIVIRTNASPFLVTLGTQLLLYGAGLAITQSQTLYGDDPFFNWIGQGVVLGVPVTLLAFLALAALFQVVLARTPYGRCLYAIGLNREAARLSGVPVNRIRLMSFMLSGLMAALAGVALASRLNSITANAGLGYDFLSIIAAVLGGTSLFGGRGGAARTVAGTLVLGLLDNVLVLLGMTFAFEDIVRGAVFLLVVGFDRLSREER